MADLERHHPAVSHSELTGGHDVTQLLSQINQTFKQSKADQILRLLKDQDNGQDKSDDDTELLQEYDKIREEKVLCDSDTLTDSSSISDITEVDVKYTTNGRTTPTNNNINNKELNSGNAGNRGSMEGRGYRSHRSRTSMGFHGEENEETNNVNFDTRDITIRPKSSYVRRRPTKTCFDTDPTDPGVSDDVQVPQQQQRLSKSARPKSRLGRASVQRSERKITMIEADTVTVEPTAPVKEDVSTRNHIGITNDRFSNARIPKRESKRKANSKTFCDDNIDGQSQVETMSVDSVHSMDTREEVTEVQPIMSSYSNGYNKENEVISAAPPRHVPQNAPPHNSSFGPHAVPRSSVQQHSQQYSSPKRTVVNPRQDQQPHPTYPHPADTHFVRSGTVANASLRASERREHVPPQQLKRTNSNLGFRPKNHEPVSSRPIERPDMRPTTRTRRLQRRYMPQAPHTSNVRPTSESVILARQKTEKNLLLKKQIDNRPHSEKIILNNQKSMLSVGENPTQGPQTYVRTNGGVSQASHVQSGGFRGYDPSSRHKSGANSRDFPADLTLPRQGPNSNMVNSRKTLAAMMKLPPLEASLAAKKKERGLSLAQRETCV